MKVCRVNPPGRCWGSSSSSTRVRSGSSPVKARTTSPYARLKGLSAARQSFQTSSTRPPGRSTRRNSGTVRAGSNQCAACAAVIRSTLAPGSPVASDVPAWTLSPPARTAPSRLDSRWARISGLGSTAATRAPPESSSAVNRPVPAPMSATPPDSSPASCNHCPSAAG